MNVQARIRGHRGLGTLLLLTIAASSSTWATVLDLDERVAAQRALDRLRYSYQIGASRSFDVAVPVETTRHRVYAYLEKSAALERYWGVRVTREMLTGEVERMLRASRDPARLDERFAALDRDPLLIRECLARPALVERLARELFDGDERIHTRTPEASARDVVPKVRWDEWWGDARRELDIRSVVVPQGSDLPLGLVERPLDEPLCEPDDSWLDGSMSAPPALSGHSAVWTGSEMILWGGNGIKPTGRRYDPVTDTWSLISTIDSSGGRSLHTAVWTGEQMIVWGGARDGGVTDSGGRYDPATDTWAPMSTDNAPWRRQEHTAVWTGEEMIVWGGRYESAADCGAAGGYECGDSDCCVANGTPGCADSQCESIICDFDPFCCDVEWDQTCADEALTDPWCRISCGWVTYDTGGRYDPVTDSWSSTATSGAPGPRTAHAGVWTGSEMLVWGGWGEGVEAGGRYDPESNSWTAMSTVDAPDTRYDMDALWTGEEMLVWGGWSGGQDRDTGGRYDPSTNTWSPMSSANCPAPRHDHSVVWTGSEMIVWGGSWLDTGGHYDPATDTWSPTGTANAPEARSWHTAVWTESEMIVWGGNLVTGGRYDPDAKSWTPTATAGGPSPRDDHTAVWSGSEMIVWGGHGGGESGGRFDPVTDTWTPTATAGAPVGRVGHTAVWAGNRMVVWGGAPGGGLYDPWTDAWTAMSETNAPQLRDKHTAVWTGNEMIVWGGAAIGTSDGLDSGSRFDPQANSWTPLATAGAPQARFAHTAIWTGKEMLVWGGKCCGWNGPAFRTGGRYDPSTDTWTPTSTIDAPDERRDHGAVWSASEMVVWGGRNGQGTANYNSGGHYDPVSDSWTPTSMIDVPVTRPYFTAVGTGSAMIVWGGWTFETIPSGGVYDISSKTWQPTTMYHAPEGRRSHSAVWTGGLMIVWGGYGPGYLGTGGMYAYGHEVDDDGDGSSECDGDCDDSRPECVFECSDADGDAYCADADCDDSRPECVFDCSDADLDEFCADADCSPVDPDTYPGAAEVNDGRDNQCPGDPGYGAVDETSGVSGFFDPEDRDAYSWPPQSGASLYEISRSGRSDFAADCTTHVTSETVWIDSTLPAVRACLYYLNRPLEPHPGSWGQDSSGAARVIVCP